jgi:uncharacterized protein
MTTQTDPESSRDSGRTLPVVDELTMHYWESAKQGKLVVQKCPTGELQWPPHADSIHAEDVPHQWVEMSGRATVFTYSVVYRSSYSYPECPYVLALVQLAEGPVMTTNIVETPLEEISIGMNVMVTFEDTGQEYVFPLFKMA